MSTETKSKIFKIKAFLFAAALLAAGGSAWLVWLWVLSLPVKTLALWALVATLAVGLAGILGFALGRMEARGFIQGQRAKAPKVVPDPAKVVASLAQEQDFPAPVIERQEERHGFTEV